jgi:site-specific DNA-methyltransferase (adenine-specific)
MSKVDIYPGDNREWLRAFAASGTRFDSVVTDPPYGLVSAKNTKTDGAFASASRGFLRKEWDGSMIERDPEFWQLVLDVMKPGAYCFAFSGTRTVHWQMVAMEQAGFVIHPLHIWMFGSGFPKGHAADKAIDRELGALDRREVTGRGEAGILNGSCEFATTAGFKAVYDITAPATPEAEQWKGWAYNTQAQKPALEPIVLAQKPFSEKNGATNILKHGVGAVNIDGCRVPSDTYTANLAGRYPANLMHDGSDPVRALFPNDSDQYFHAFYHRKANKADRAGSKHPTVKPIALMQYLIRHVTPPGGTVLDPFAGSGTTGEAAKLEGVNCTLLEREAEYLEFLYKRFAG